MSAGRVYVGVRQDGQNIVTVTEPRKGTRALPLCLDLVNHSPDGFEWGYSGSGPAQLAVAILADFCGKDSKALKLHLVFKDEVIARLHGDKWRLDAHAIQSAINRIEERLASA